MSEGEASLDALAADRQLANASRALVTELETYCKRHGLSLDAIGWSARIGGKTITVGIGAPLRDWLTTDFRAAGEKGARSKWQLRR